MEASYKYGGFMRASYIKNNPWGVPGGLSLTGHTLSLIGIEINWDIKRAKIQHDSTQKIFVSKHQNKATFKNLEALEPLYSLINLIGLTSPVPSQNFLILLGDHPWHQNDQYWSLFEEWIIKNPTFH